MNHTSQTIIASWLVPFLPCCVKSDATSLDPFKNIRPGILCSTSSFLESKEEFREAGLLFELLLFLTEVVGEPGRGLLLSVDKQDPILRALIILSRHSSPARQSQPLFSVWGSVTTLSIIPQKLKKSSPPAISKIANNPLSTTHLNLKGSGIKSPLKSFQLYKGILFLIALGRANRIMTIWQEYPLAFPPSFHH